MAPEHRFPLGKTSWTVWRDGLLRTTGFPAAGLDRLAAPASAALANAHLAGAATRNEFAEAFEATVIRCSNEINRIAADPLLREAIMWQNPEAVTLLDSLRRSGSPAPRNSKRRYRELQLTRFWQRYCGKTETIGFFGPGLWATVDGDSAGVRAIPGPGLVERRRVCLEPWVLTSYGAVLANEPDIRCWLPPAPMPHHWLDGDVLHRPGRPPQRLTSGEAVCLSLCDGHRPAAHVVAALADHTDLAIQDAADGYRLLADLVARRLVTWDANLPLGPQTEQLLRKRIAAIEPEPLRGRARAGLDRLDHTRRAVAKAAGDPAALSVAMARLAAEFTDLTGREPRRRHGRTYAGRGLCYEDTTRDLRVLVGANLIDGIAAPLGLMLQAARWFTSEVASRYEAALQKLFVNASRGGQPTTLADLWYPAIELFWGDDDRPVDGVLESLYRRWATLFGESLGSAGSSRLNFDSPGLLLRLPDVFPASRPGWSIARIHSPDLHVCATSVQAINAGDFLAVLGELHVAHATLCDRWCTWSRTEPGRLLELAIQDFGQRRLVPLLPPLWGKDAGRTVQIEDAATDLQIGFAKSAAVDANRLVPISAVVVCMEGERLVGVLPDDSRYPLLEFFSHFLSAVTVDAFRNVGTDRHTPRVTVDRTVLFRETWRIPMDDLRDLLTARDEADQYLAGRRLVAVLGLPRRCFTKVPTETKPVYIDFTSPHYVASLCTMLRAARNAGGDSGVVLTEMLPTPEQTWVPDRAGRTYFGELRLHMTDPEVAQTVSAEG